MKLYTAVIFILSLSVAYSLRCYTCTLTEPRSCTDTKSCPVIFNRCFSLRAEGYDMVTKGCQTSVACIGAIACCEGDLCNSAMQTAAPGLMMLLLSSTVLSFVI